MDQLFSNFIYVRMFFINSMILGKET